MCSKPCSSVSMPIRRRCASVARRSRGVVGYNVQIAVDTQHHLIVTHEVTNTGSGRSQLSNMASQAKDVLQTDHLDGEPVGGVLSTRSIAALAAYLERIGVELHSDAYIFRNRSGAPYSSDTLGDDFRDVWIAEFGNLDRRTIGHDFRRTGAVEAIVGGANSDFPVNVGTLRDVMKARRVGRRKLR